MEEKGDFSVFIPNATSVNQSVERRRTDLRKRKFASGTSFLMPFAGTDIWFSELSGIGKQQNLIQGKLLEQGQVLGKMVGKANVAVNLVGTRLDRSSRQLLSSIVLENRAHIKKLVFVGSGLLDRIHLRRRLGQNRGALGFRYGFLDDYEKAKLFLVEK